MAALPLILVPGLLLTEDLWADIRPALKGLADPISVTRAGRDHDNLPDIAAAILADAPERFAIAGLSMGCYVAFEILRQAPERVARLALLNSTARPDGEAKRKERQDLIRLAQMGKFRGVTPALLPTFLHADNLQNENLRQRIFAMAAEVGRDGFIRQQTAIMGRPDSRPLLPTIRIPTLVIGGAGDRLTPPDHAQEMADLIPDAKLAILDRAGHLAPMETPDETARLMMNWLRD